MTRKAISLLLCITTLLCSCQKEDRNGDLGGFWKVMQLTPANKAGIDCKEKSLFWRVQLQLLQIGGEYARFGHSGDSLHLQLIGSYNSCLKDYGVYKKDESYAVLYLDRNGMTLKSDSAEIRFKKF